MTEKSKADRQGTFTGELWDAIRPVYAAILEHPFLRGLADGTLPEERFRYYISQDTLSLCKKSAVSGKVPAISALPSGSMATESLSIL